MDFEMNQKEALGFINEFFNETDKMDLLSLSDIELYERIKDIHDFTGAVNESYALQKVFCKDDVVMTDKMYEDFCNRVYDLVIRKISQIIYTRYKDFDLQAITNYDIVRELFAPLFEKNPNFTFKILEDDEQMEKCMKFLLGFIVYVEYNALKREGKIK